MSDNLLSGLEKLGLDVSGMDNLFAEEKKEPVKQEETAAPVDNTPKETEFLLEKSIRCPMCEKVFKTKNIKSARARRLGADPDLRPRYEYVDPTKYDVDSCPFCGYTAISRFFPGENLTSIQRKALQEGVCAKLTKYINEAPALPETYTYDEAVERYKLALFNAMVKNAKTSEKAYTCLKISWLMRGKAEELEAAENKDEAAIAAARAEENKFYEQAYDGMTKALSTENTPICGMDQSTVEYLLAQMAFKLKKYTESSRLVANILVSQTAGNNVKNKARDLEDELVNAIRAGK